MEKAEFGPQNCQGISFKQNKQTKPNVQTKELRKIALTTER